MDCKKLRKTKSPKCTDQKGCEWVAKKGCVKRSGKKPAKKKPKEPKVAKKEWEQLLLTGDKKAAYEAWYYETNQKHTFTVNYVNPIVWNDPEMWKLALKLLSAKEKKELYKIKKGIQKKKPKVPSRSKGCKQYKKTKDPKCNDQKGCEWVAKKGCVKRSGKKKDPVGVMIGKMMAEGKPHKQAVAIALNMKEKKRLDKEGNYIKACSKQTTKKYTTRKSPPYKAQECRGKVKEGNDGNLYISKPNKNDVYRWVKKPSKPSKSRKSSGKRVYKLSDRDVEILCKEVSDKYHDHEDFNYKFIEKYAKGFKTTERHLKGNFGTYDASKDDYSGLYGYVMDQIDGYFKYGKEFFQR